MTIIQTNVTEYTAYYKGYKAKGRDHAEALIACLWRMRDNGIYIPLN